MGGDSYRNALLMIKGCYPQQRWSDCVCTGGKTRLRLLAEQTRQQRNQGDAHQSDTAASHELFHTQIGVGKRLDGGRRRCPDWHHPDSSAVWSVRLRAAGGISRLYIRNRSILAVDNSPLIRSALRYESPPINERRCYYAVFDPHYFSSEPSQDPYQPLQLRTVTTEWKPFLKPLPTGSKAS